MNDRIIKLIKAEGLTNSKFASILGIQRSNVTHIVDGRNKPSLSFIEKLITKFPRVNVEWLMTGTGEMYKQKETSEQKAGQKKDDSPTLFPDVVLPQLTSSQKENQSARQTQNVEQDSEKIAEVTNIPTEQKSEPQPGPETKLMMDTLTKQETTKTPEPALSPTLPQNTEGIKSLKHLTPFEPEHIDKINEREIECVLIFYSDKTFKYYKPQ
jgi:transcriptional regulator with XRE-family HTH domain